LHCRYAQAAKEREEEAAAAAKKKEEEVRYLPMPPNDNHNDCLHGDPTASPFLAQYLRCRVCAACGVFRAEWPIRRCVSASGPRCCQQFMMQQLMLTSCSSTRVPM
jgi:hypothetical protein